MARETRMAIHIAALMVRSLSGKAVAVFLNSSPELGRLKWHFLQVFVAIRESAAFPTITDLKSRNKSNRGGAS
jgi:hypothetical protein